MDELNEMMSLSFGENVPQEIRDLAERVAAEGEFTMNRRSGFLDAMHEYVLRNATTIHRRGGVVYKKTE